jgi:hypothetical protein
VLGLKTYFPTLAEYVGASPVQLNEWMRALVSVGALSARPGRGPGSGVELSATSVSVLLLALLSSDIRNEAAEWARKLSKAKPLPQRQCSITGARTLRDAIARGLEGKGLYDGRAASLAQINVERGEGIATLRWNYLEGAYVNLPFSLAIQDPFAKEKRTVTATLHSEPLRRIAEDLTMYELASSPKGARR